MTIAKLIVRLAAIGGEQVKAELKDTKKEVKDTATAMTVLKDQVNEVQIGGKGLVDIYTGVSATFARMGATLGAAAGLAGGAAIAVVGFGAALGGLTLEAYKFAWQSRGAGIEFESMQRRLEGLTGSASRAASILALAKREAGPSMFTTQQLEQASVMLAAYGLNVERIIPLVTRLGQAFGADQEHMMMYSRAFGQMASGRLPESEVMAQMGISKRELAGEGIKFDKQGSLLSSAEETMSAFERIIYTKFDAAYKASTTTTEAMQASITDSFEQMQRSMGMAVNNGLKPFLTTFGDMIKIVSESNFAKLFGEDLMRPIAVFTGAFADAKVAIVTLMATLATMASIIPTMAAKVFEDLKAITTGSFGEKVAALGRMALRTNPASAATEIVMEAQRLADRYAVGMVKGGGGTSAIDEAMKRKPFLPSGGGELPEDSKTKKHKASVEHHLQRISNNTKKSADLLDLRNQTIGGGRLAALGITGAELASSGMRVRTELNKARPVSGDSMVTRGIKQMIQNNMGFAVNGGRSVPVR
jgi:hypothetical protein